MRKPKYTLHRAGNWVVVKQGDIAKVLPMVALVRLNNARFTITCPHSSLARDEVTLDFSTIDYANCEPKAEAPKKNAPIDMLIYLSNFFTCPT